jgi:hypothetical protein
MQRYAGLAGRLAASVAGPSEQSAGLNIYTWSAKATRHDLPCSACGFHPVPRVYLTTIVSLAGVALAAWFGMQAGAAGPGRRWWTQGAVAASVTAAGVPAYEQIR